MENMSLIKPILFFHIMKTGGTTFTAFIDNQFDFKQICPARHWYEFDALLPEDLERYRLFRGHFNLRQVFAFQEFPYTLTILRNPVDRVISEYFHWKRAPATFALHNPQYALADKSAKSLSLDEFIERDSESGFYINNRQAYQLALPDSMPRVGTDLSEDDVLSQAKKNIDKFSLTGTTDTVNQMAQILSFHFGWFPPKGLPTLRSMKSEQREIVSLQTRQRILVKNQLDAALFDYATEKIEAQYKDFLDNIQVASKGDQEAVYSRLLKKYNDRYLLRHPRTYSRYWFGFEAALDGDGWHQRQGEGEADAITWRWTGPGPESVLDLPLAHHQDLEVSFEILKAATPDLYKSLKIRVNDISLPYRLEKADGRIICFIDIPVSVLKRSPGQARFCFSLSHTVQIPDRYPDSVIQAGIALTGIHIRPLGQLEKLKHWLHRLKTRL